MLNLIRADLFKLYKSRVFKILCAITTLCAIVMTIIMYLISQGKMDSANGIGFLFSDVNVISIIGAVAAGVFICGDFDNKSIHDAISCGHGRSSVIISKAIVFFFAIAFLLLPYAVISVIALGTGNAFYMDSAALGFLNLLIAESGTSFSAGIFLKMFAIILILMFVYIAQLSICVPIALAFKKPILVVAVFYAVSLLSGRLAGMKGSYPAFDSIYAFTPYGGNYSFLTLDSGIGDMIKAIAVGLIFIVLMLFITHSIFKKTDVK